jgi:hypothetical protein
MKSRCSFILGRCSIAGPLPSSASFLCPYSEKTSALSIAGYTISGLLRHPAKAFVNLLLDITNSRAARYCLSSFGDVLVRNTTSEHDPDRLNCPQVLLFPYNTSHAPGASIVAVEIRVNTLFSILRHDPSHTQLTQLEPVANQILAHDCSARNVSLNEDCTILTLQHSCVPFRFLPFSIL